MIVYIEKELKKTPFIEKIERRLKPKTVVWIDHYGEIFNRHGQHFRLQKKYPAFILAQKKGTFVYKAPPTYGIGLSKNYYFSHLLNCPFDCRYCFLQGMYRSAHYVLFVNYPDFKRAITEQLGFERATFFSGYDGDSLALESYSGFLASFLPFFANLTQAELEIRTKSTAIRPLLSSDPTPNIIVAYSLSPAPIAKEFELKTPSLEARLKALTQLEECGWPIGLRFDPILYVDTFQETYRTFFRRVFSTIKGTTLHSVTLGSFRLPKPLYKSMKEVAPREPLLAQCSESSDQKMGILPSREEELLKFCIEEIKQWIPKEKLFVCR